MARGRRHGAGANEPKGSNLGPWTDAINRLLRAADRPDPRNPKRLKRWTQADLAENAGVRQNTLSEILNGREPSLDTLTKLSASLGVPLWAMFVTDRQAALLMNQQEQDDLALKRTSIAEEVRLVVGELLAGPIADKLTEATMARMTGHVPHALAVEPKHGKKKRSA